jgi:hypothetical protein
MTQKISLNTLWDSATSQDRVFHSDDFTHLPATARRYLEDTDVKVYSLTALIFTILLAGITSSVHFVILSVSRQLGATGLTWVPLSISFKWQSVAYTLDILAWDWFFALSMLFAAPVFRKGRLERTVQILMIVSGVLSLAGLIGVPLEDMQVRTIGVLGYAVVSPIVFLLLGMVFGRA